MAKQQLKETQHLKILPQQLQLMRYLTLPITDLSQAIEQEVTENAMLEIAPDTDNSNPDENMISDENNGLDADKDNFEDQVIDPFEDFDDSDNEDYRYREHLSSDPNQKDFETIIESGSSFTQSLLEQLSYKDLSEKERIIGEALICSLDDAGYLSRSIALLSNDLAFKNNIDATPDEIELVLLKVQQLEPAGIGARTAQECILIQLLRLPHSPIVALATQIMQDYFEQWSNHQYEFIANKLKLSQTQIKEVENCIHHLNPKPGHIFLETNDSAATILPDFIISSEDNQSISFDLNEKGIPNVQISGYYLNMLQEYESKTKPTVGDKEALRFLREKNENAQSFIEMLHQRQLTLCNIMQSIIDLQRPFLLSGNESDLNPMKLQDIADRTGYDPSTISRVVNEKYVQTDFGTLLLKDFFSKAVATDEGAVSAKKLQQAIRDAIAAENSQHPLTDDMLVELLSKEGYTIARRTVAKYRTEMGIPSSSKRKGLSR